METETTETGASTESDAGEGTAQPEVETIAIPKGEYDKLNQTLGSLKRELKDLKKPKDTETPQKTGSPEDNGLLQKTFLRAANITAPDEVEFALDKAKKWGVEVDALVDDEDFQQSLDKFRTKKANAVASSNVRGGNAPSQAKNTPEYWIAKGTPPSPTDVPDRKTRGKIAIAMMAAQKSSKQFYNE